MEINSKLCSAPICYFMLARNFLNHKREINRRAAAKTLLKLCEKNARSAINHVIMRASGGIISTAPCAKSGGESNAGIMVMPRLPAHRCRRGQKASWAKKSATACRGGLASSARSAKARLKGGNILLCRKAGRRAARGNRHGQSAEISLNRCCVGAK